MIDLAEARRIAEASIGGADDKDRIEVQEYEDGFVAWIPPDPTEVDEDGFPSTVGAGCVVIDRADGKVYRTAYLGPHTMDDWREARAAGEI